MLDVAHEAERSKAIGPAAPVGIQQYEWEFSRLLDLYRERQPKRVLEIGTCDGGTLYWWLKESPKAIVVNVDQSAGSTLHLFQKWCSPLGELHTFLANSHSPETIRDVSAFGPFDWVFIDGDHSYSGCKQDWDSYGAMCPPGAIVAFHDIESDSRGVHGVWDEIQKQGYVTQELIAEPGGQNGVGIVYMP